MIEECVHFYADNLKLEGVLTYNEDASPSQAILLCAPHPNLGGDMDNNVITNLGRVSAGRGFASLRFNYRGVGNSECQAKDIAMKFRYWEESLNGGDYMGAVSDTQAALDFLVSQIVDRGKIFIAGYSFGSIAGMKVGVESIHVTAFASISTPFDRYDLNYLQGCSKPKLFIYSQNDFAATEEETLKGFENMPPPKVIELIERSDHFYRMQEGIVSQKVCSFFLGYSFPSGRSDVLA